MKIQFLTPILIGGLVTLAILIYIKTQRMQSVQQSDLSGGDANWLQFCIDPTFVNGSRTKPELRRRPGS